MIDPEAKTVRVVATEPYTFTDGWLQFAVTKDGVIKLTLTTSLPGSEDVTISARVAMTGDTAQGLGEALTKISKISKASGEPQGRA